MRNTLRPSIFRYLLYILVAIGIVVASLLLLANQVVRKATLGMEEIVEHHVRPLASMQRLQSNMDTLRGLELELRQFDDFFAVPYHIDNMQRELVKIESALVELRDPLSRIQPTEVKRLAEHWQIYRQAIGDQIELARTMRLDQLSTISTTRSRGAHDALSAILRELIDRTEQASSAAYKRAQQEAHNQQLLVSTTLALGLALLFVIIWSFGRSISRRISVLSEAAESVALGEQIEPIPVTGHDELAELGHAFNTMQTKVLEREDELRAAHERLEQRAQSAEEATLAKSQFLANMSHEIRTPMNGVLGMLEILRETRMNPEQHDYVNTAHESATALLDLLNDILDLSKIEAGKVRLEQLEFDLQQLIDDAVAVLADRALSKGLRLDVSIDPGLPHHLFGDPNRLRQVLSNLLSNAIKFTTQGHVTIFVTPTTSHDGQPLLHVEVRDTGIGIPSSKQAQIFDAFTQADGSTTRRFGGTGLGLSICSQLVHAMGGQIGVDSTPGLGSNFWFTLPLKAVEGPSHLTPEALGKARVLVVCHDAEQRQQLVRRLEAWNCGVHAVADGAQLAYTAHDSTTDSAPFGLALIAGAPRDPRFMALLDQLRSVAPQARTLLMTPPGQPCADGCLKSLQIDQSLSWPLRKSQLKNALLQLLGPSADKEAGKTQAGTTKLRVLIAEDNPINQKVATSMLKKIGCEADIADNGHEAVECFRKTHYDMVLMDCQMPEMDGFEATETIRAEEDGTQRIPIVAMTAHAMPSDRERCLAAGMDDYLTKPISVEQLRAVIARWQEHAPVAQTNRAQGGN